MSDTSRSRSVTDRISSGRPPIAPGPAGQPPVTHPPTAHLASLLGADFGPLAQASPVQAALVQDALPLLREWLPRQRWFAGKGRPVSAVVPTGITALPGSAPGDPLLLHLLLDVTQLGPDGSSETDVYQLLLGARSGADRPEQDPEAQRAALVGRISGGPNDGLLIYDAAYDDVLTQRLLRLLADSGPKGTQVGPLRFSNLDGDGGAVGLGGPDSLSTRPSRVGTAEQSNTSIVFGNSAILKLFRRVGPGLNPDLELSLALSRAGSTRVPSTLAWYEGELPRSRQQPDKPEPEPEPATLGLLQRYLHGGRDGWEFALAHVQRLRTAPALRTRPIDQITGNFSAESFLLGRCTAEIHLTLAEVLPVAVLTPADIEALATTMARRLDAAALVVPALAPYRSALHLIFQSLADSARDGRRLQAQRIHGDLHLGQSMRTGRGWVLLDFEGEPAKSLAERRRPQPAVRDVAAILRSFDYAAAHLLSELSPGDPQRGPLADLAATWALRNREAFCAGYAAAGAEDPTSDLVLLHALETDKAVYEVVYEARNRPGWLPIPLSAIARLARAAESRRLPERKSPDRKAPDPGPVR